MKFLTSALGGALALAVTLVQAGSVAPFGGTQSVGNAFNSGTHGTNAGSHDSSAQLSQAEEWFVEFLDEEGKPRPKIYDECLQAADSCKLKIVNPSNEHGGVTVRVVDRILGFLDVATDSQGFIVTITRISA